MNKCHKIPQTQKFTKIFGEKQCFGDLVGDKHN